MIVAVLDTNVLASGVAGLTKPDSLPGELLRRWQAGAFLLIVSEPILTELAATFTYPYFTRRLSATEIEAAFVRLCREGLLQPITVPVTGIATHSHDDPILATALSAEAPFLVTGDKPLLSRRSYKGTRLLTPRQFLAVPAGETYR